MQHTQMQQRTVKYHKHVLLGNVPIFSILLHLCLLLMIVLIIMFMIIMLVFLDKPKPPFRLV